MNPTLDIIARETARKDLAPGAAYVAANHVCTVINPELPIGN